MSLGIINKNTGSPFMLRRSIVDQGGQGGAYESGGFNPEATYSDGGAAEAIASVGKVVGAAISSRTAGDENKSDISKSERISKRTEKINSKISESSTDAEKAKASKKTGRLTERKNKVDSRIKEYNEFVKPTLASDVKKI